MNVHKCVRRHLTNPLVLPQCMDDATSDRRGPDPEEPGSEGQAGNLSRVSSFLSPPDDQPESERSLSATVAPEACGPSLKRH